jgi:general secretion pathway protein C
MATEVGGAAGGVIHGALGERESRCRFNHNPGMTFVAPPLLVARSLAVLIWACAVGSGVVWALKWASPLVVPAATAVNEHASVAPDAQRMGRLLGTVPAAVAAAAPKPAEISRFVLHGVVASGRHAGAALIAADGKPARPYRVGQAVTDGTWLMGVEPRVAVLGRTASGPETARLSLSPPPSMVPAAR